MTQEILVLGGGPVGHTLATRLHTHDRVVTFVDADEGAVRRARASDFDAHESALEPAAIPDELQAQTVILATSSDARNLLLAVSAPKAFGADDVIALVNDPRNRIAFEDADIETICVSETVAVEATRGLVETESTPTTEKPLDQERERVRG